MTVMPQPCVYVLPSGLMDYNFHCLRKAIHEVFEVRVVQRRGSDHLLDSPGSSSGGAEASMFHSTTEAWGGFTGRGLPQERRGF